jgi:hypothetical protein
MTSIIDSTRKNHALEHATMTILAERYRGVRMMGHSSPVGFILMADLPTEIVTEVVLEAKHRLENGEPNLAVHPNCGTNMAVSSLASSAAAFSVLGLLSNKGKNAWWHYLIATFVAIPAFHLAKPLGPKLQKNLTTDPDTQDMAVQMVTSQKTANSFIHFIRTSAI